MQMIFNAKFEQRYACNNQSLLKCLCQNMPSEHTFFSGIDFNERWFLTRNKDTFAFSQRLQSTFYLTLMNIRYSFCT